MHGIDETLIFYPLRIAILTITGGQDKRPDRSGALLIQRVTDAGHELASHDIIGDDILTIRSRVSTNASDPLVDLIITTGGTGFSDHDATPEAVRPLLDREMDGFAAVFHQKSQATVGISSLQSRPLAGQIGTCFIFCLPGSSGACRDGWDHILATELDSRYRPCSLAGQIPRLRHLCS